MCEHCPSLQDQNEQLTEEVSALLKLTRKQARENRSLTRKLQEVREQDPKSQTIRGLLEHWQNVHGKHRSSIEAGGDRWERARKWLKTYPPHDIEDAITGILWSRNHVANERGERFVEVEHILNPRQSLFEKFRDYGRTAREQGLEPPDFQALDRRDGDADLRRAEQRVRTHTEPRTGAEPLPSEDEVTAMAERLQRHDKLLTRLHEVKGWTAPTLARLYVGWDGARVVFPVRDTNGTLVCIQRYLPGGKPKMLAPKGRPRNLFPSPEILDDELWLVEGEPDAVTGHELGVSAVGVPGASAWHDDWTLRFEGARVVVCLDCDKPGRKAAQRIARELMPVAKDVRVLDLDREREDGFDLTDFALAGGTGDSLWALVKNAASVQTLRRAA